MTKQEIDIKVLMTVVGSFLGVVISLGVVLGWSTDNKVSCATTELRKETAAHYVSKELYTLQIEVLNENLKTLGRAVGARGMREISQ